MPDADPRELVRITHPDVDAVGGPVPRSALRVLVGWSVAGEDQPTTVDEPLRTKADLERYAAAHGVDVTGASTKADLAARIDAHNQTPAPIAGEPAPTD